MKNKVSRGVVNESGGGKSVSVKKGGSITLQNDVKVQRDDLIVWRFGDKGVLLAKYDVETTSLNGSDERFRDRLQLDHQTGSLTITNTRTTDSGLNELQTTGRESSQQFLLSVKVKTKMWGKSVTLSPKTKINKGDQILWLFEDEKTCIAEIKKGIRKIKDDVPDGRFSESLELDNNTGSLTIKNITNEHTGLYKLKIRRGIKTLYEEFSVFVSEMMISVTEGESVTLDPDTEINKDDHILLWFGDENMLTAIAEKHRETQEMLTYEYAADGRFREKLKLDMNTGSLTITNIRTDHAGRYKLEIRGSGGGVSEKTFIVTVKDKVEEKLLYGEESVTLNPDTEIQKDDLMLWMFGDEDTLIAQIKGQNGEIIKYDDVAKVRFREKLELDKKTGSLTITKIIANHTGLYKLLIINSRGTSYKKFKVLKQVRYEYVIEGESVTLKTDAEIQKDDQIEWRFGEKDSLIAEIKGETGETSIYDHVPDGRFIDRLHLNKKTGSLTITDITTIRAGVYKLKITSSSKGKTNRTFIVTISARTNPLKRKNENRKNESVTVGMPLLNRGDVDVVNEHPYEN
ncbi:uncharacterized protein LOC125263453 isoform X2 [Megalobrama amblycephala]|uniref:uncharacterized protein LOC125263453 isoform X2 n=1 Tax=Megalobrama amblycephala TaxID=75352 RepID=UPI002013EFFA|nr:uncharacterized protein LOC125263453 isoform X2 [Megalobrama amblycephala]